MANSIFITPGDQGEQFSGQLVGPAANNTAAPPFSFLGDLTSGYASSAVGTLDLVTAGTSRLKANAQGVGVGATIPATTSTLAQLFVGNSTVGAQSGAGGEYDLGWNFYYNSGFKYRITDTAGKIGYNTVASGAWSIQTAISGTADAAISWVEQMRISPTAITANNHLLFGTDNTYDIGASGATRARNIYAGTRVIAPAYTVGASAGASGTGTVVSQITVVNGIVTSITVA